jgi:DNA-binding MarR family transcriptional regulator
MPPADEPLADLVQELIRHSRLLHLLKGQAATLAPAGLDAAALHVLGALVRCGPRRQGEIAGATMLDPSTVSRYVGQLVRAGLVARRPDPEDGRAVQLVATDAGRTLAEEAAARRQAAIGRVIGDWAPEDARELVRLLRRFNDDLDAAGREGPESTLRAMTG